MADNIFKKGYAIFGKPYEIMLKNDLHDIRSINHELIKNMILLNEDSFKFLYYKPINIDMSKHELYQFSQKFKGKNDKESIKNVLDYTSDIANKYDVDFKDMLFGGTEKEILERGTDWCSDMARVGSVLLRCLGIPCRMINLFNLDKAYNAHVAGEAFYENHYGVIDFIYGYQFYDDKPVNAYEIMKNNDYLNNYSEYYQGLFKGIAINEYNPMDRNNNYIVSKPNEYYLKLIYSNHNDKWITDEDK